MSSKRRFVWFNLFILMFALAALSFTASAGSAVTAAGTTFIHVTTTNNRSCDYESCTIIDHPLTNGSPGAALFVTQLLGNKPVYNPHEIGVLYNGSHWMIFNLDKAPMPPKTKFMVWVSGFSPGVRLHLATVHTISENMTWITDFWQEEPDPIYLTTRNWQPNTRRNNHITSVRQQEGTQWVIYNQDLGEMKRRTTFNITRFSAGGPYFSHQATAENSAANYTLIDNVHLNNIPNARFMVNQSRTHQGADTGVDLNAPIAVRYHTEEGKWAIYNASVPHKPIPVGAAFHVAVLETAYVKNEILLNGSFEAQKSSAEIPTLWVGEYDWQSKRVCNTGYYYAGHCGLYFKTNGEARTFTQTIKNPRVSAAHELAFSGFVQSQGISAEAVFTIILKYGDGSSDKLVVKSGTEDSTFRAINGSIVPDKQVAEIVVRIKMPKSTGTLNVDELHLLRYPLPVSLATMRDTQ